MNARLYYFSSEDLSRLQRQIKQAFLQVFCGQMSLELAGINRADSLSQCEEAQPPACNRVAQVGELNPMFPHCICLGSACQAGVQQSRT